MIKFLKYLKPYIKECILAPVFKMLEATFELLVPLVVAAMVDKGINGSNKTMVLSYGGLLIILAIVGLTASITAQYFSAKAATKFGQEVRYDLFNHINGLSFNDQDRAGTSTLITRMTSDVTQMQTGVNMVLRLFLRSPFIVFGAIFMASRVSRDFLGIFSSIVGILFVVVFAVILISIPLIKKVQQKLDLVTLHTRENLVGVRVVRAFNRQDEEREEFISTVKSHTRMQLIVGSISSILNPATFVIINFGIVVVLYSGGVAVYDGRLATGDVIALVEYMSMILVELIKLANFIITVSKMFAGARRVSRIFDIKTDMEFPSETKGEPGKCSVVFDHVSMRYVDASDDCISDISFSAKAGETIGIIGGTGSGKSSLVSLIPRFYDTSSGSITIDGIDIKDYSREDIRGKVSYVPQKAVLFKGTIAENLRWGNKDASDEELLRALDLSQAREFVDKKEGGMNFSLSQGAKNLSGGQKQRLTIARAFVKNSDIMVFDDSSSALDFATDAKLRNCINSIKEDKIIFIVSQRASSIMHADKILVLDKGILVGQGTHDELLATCDIYKEICLSQMNETEVAS